MYIKDTVFLYINLSHFLSLWKVWLLSALRKKKKKGYAPLFPFIVQSIPSYQTVSD